MGSNSDALRNVLTFVKNNPDKVIINNNKYNNAIQMLIQDDVAVGNPDLFFPKNRIRANRMNRSFLEENSHLLDYFSEMTDTSSMAFNDVWISTSHILELGKYFLDLSFE